MTEEKTKEHILEKIKRIIPGTEQIEHCKVLETCMDNRFRSCGDIKMLCITCRGECGVLGGISFLFDARNGIVIQRYNEAESYIKAIVGKGFDDIAEKYEKDDVLNEITKSTKLLRDERKEAEDQQKIDAFKRQDIDILVTRRNKKTGEYQDIDKKLIEIAKEKEQKTGKKIKIIDESELEPKIYILGISSKKVLSKIELEIKSIEEADERIYLLIFKSKQPEYAGFLVIRSVNDDIIGDNNEKDRWRDYFTEKFSGLDFIDTITMDRLKVVQEEI